MFLEVTAPESGIAHKEENCSVYINHTGHGPGTLYISEDNIVWMNEHSKGLCLKYESVAIHAVSTDLTAFSEECLYIMYNGDVPAAQNGVNGTTHEEEDDGQEPDGEEFGAQYGSDITEIRFTPGCKENLRAMFNAMSDCQCLHPDPEDIDDYDDRGHGDSVDPDSVEYNPNFEGGADGGFYTTEEGFQHLSPQGQATLQRLEATLASTENVTDQMGGVAIENDEPIARTESDEPPRVGRDVDEPLFPESKSSVEGQFDDA